MGCHNKSLVKAHEERMQATSHRAQLERSAEFAEEFQCKLRDEEKLRLQTEEECKAMEQHEAMLIARLKETQEKQRNAYTELEEVLNLEPEEVMKRQPSPPRN